MPDQSGLAELVPRLAGHRIVVVGDLFLDEYLVGRATRLSREAPVPVLEFERRFTLPGGAANPAHNVVSLGSFAQAVGVIGDDEAGQTLLTHLREAGIQPLGVVTDPGRPTTVKTRIVAQGALRFPQQLVRLDRLDRSPVQGEVAAELRACLEALLPQASAVLVSNYRTGVVTTELARMALEKAHSHRIPIAADTQGDLERFIGYDLVKCNVAEASTALDRELNSNEDFESAALELQSRLGIGAVVITRGPAGLTLLESRSDPVHLPATNVTEVFDVTGAGDTVIAVLTLGLAADIPLLSAAWLANYAAGLVIRRLGNAVVTPAELVQAITVRPSP